MGISRLGSEIPTHVPGNVVTPGFQEHGWESALAFRLDICWELGIQALGSNRLGTPWGAAVSAKRSTIINYLK